MGPSTFFSSITSARELGLVSPERWRRDNHFPDVLARKLRLEKVLEGHTLCVNRLAWNAQGSRLGSGSDDRRVLVWHFPDYHALPLALNTCHDCNIFAVQFLPCTGDRLMVSGAMDHTVQLHHLDVDPAGPLKYPSKAAAQSGGRQGGNGETRHWRGIRSPPAHEVIEVDPQTTVYSCHRSRVKDVEVEPMNPHNFWSACEDGFIRQFDVRTGDQSDFTSQNVLIQLRGKAGEGHVELKGLDINKVQSYQMAVACADPYIRIYDRRRLSTCGPGDVSPEPMLTLAPPHLSLCPGRRSHATYVNFSNGGDKVVASYHGDHAYSFDITGEGAAACAFVQPKRMHSKPEPASTGYISSEERATTSSRRVVPCTSPKAEECLSVARSAVDRSHFDRAIKYFTRAIYFSPDTWGIYVERASALLERGFVGDAGFALRDCDQAILLKDDLPDAHFLRLRTLKALGQLQTASALYKNFVSKFPGLKNAEDVKGFRAKLNVALSNEASKELNKRKRRRQASRNRWDYERDDDTAENEEESSSADEDFGLDIADKSEEEILKCQEDCLKYYCGEGNSEKELASPGIWFGTAGGRRMLTRFIGHCNVQTDIKESVFVGQNDELVACGSDDGKVFIYNAMTGQPVQVLKADSDVANCVQCHPSLTVLATSGLESVIRLWSPTEDTSDRDEDMEKLISKNQDRMRAGPQSLISPIINEQTFMQMQLILDNYELVQMLSGRENRERWRGGGDRDEDGDGTERGQAPGNDDDDDDDDDNNDGEDYDGSNGRSSHQVNCRMS
ncbi:hypothetical protein BSKO_03788 [Bryopsis sp. KO-2023]|nr:hypothetical protein BSKO_03788 [Bryopsis sp. KO-2023]